MSDAETPTPQRPRQPYHRPLFGSAGSWLFKITILAATFGLGFVTGADDPDAKELIKVLESDVKKEVAKIPKNTPKAHQTDHRDRKIPDYCLNPPHSKPIVGLAGIHVDGAVGFDLTNHLEDLPVRSLRQMGVSFTYLRASRGVSAHSKHFSEAWSRLATCGLLRGVIHDFRPEMSVEKQIANFLKQTKGNFGELPPVVDIHRAHGSHKHKCDKDLEKVQKFVDAVAEASKRDVVIRTPSEFWNKNYNCPTGERADGGKTLQERPLWIVDPDKPSPTLPVGWTSWVFWEKASKGRLGRTNKVPVEAFNGDINKLEDWAKDAKNG